ncbi:MAG: transketolase [Chitinophagaceae bacterium]
MQKLQEIATQIRRDIIRMTHACQSGHPGGALGCTDFLTVLFGKVMKYSPKKWTMEGKNQDIFILSNGHLSALYYAVLARFGYFSVEELKTFRFLNSRLQGHPTNHTHLPGVHIATGSLGQGISVANGVAYAKKKQHDNHYVFVLTGDGELQEGQVWEAFMFAANYKLDNLIVTIDYNGLQIDGKTEEVMSLGNLHQKLSGFGFEVLTMNGNNIEEVVNILEKSKQIKGKPIAIIMHTIMGKGVDFMENNCKWHGSTPSDEQCEKALAQLCSTMEDY